MINFLHTLWLHYWIRPLNIADEWCQESEWHYRLIVIFWMIVGLAFCCGKWWQWNKDRKEK